MFVSSSARCQCLKTPPVTQRLTPGLNVEGDDRLGSRLYLAGLLLVVLSKTLSLDALSLLVNLVVRAEKVDIVVVLSLGLLLGGSGGVQGELAGLGAVGGGLLGWVTGEGLELALEGENMVVPPPGVRELLGGRDLLDLLEDLDVGLRRGVAVVCQTMTPPGASSKSSSNEG